ncbi:MAG: AMP-binding protein [Polaribacter sp.]|nr:AMP-binding protein [Polaribacter sp.]MDG1811512.1 AMP-binding protein [Polaribacter sp.]MDG1993241.1 AMP-binding protein [Polaribacter sp.]
MKNNRLHKDFKLNGSAFSNLEELFVFSEQLDVSTRLFIKDWFSKSDNIKVQTSGSTGVPKTIHLKKEFMINSAKATGTFFMLQEKTTALLCMSTNFIAGKMMLVRAFVLGWDLELVTPVSNPLRVATKKYDFAAMVPLQLQNSLSEIYRVSKLIVGGGVVSLDLEKKIQSVSTAIYATFGMTETITHIAARKLNKNTSINQEEKSFYHVLPNISISKDTRGCLVILAPNISEETIVTNDVVEIVSDNAFKWLGRFDNVVNSGGIKLHPELIERKLSKVLSQRFFVAGIPDENLGEKLILIIEGAQFDFNLNSVLGISKFEKPKSIFFLPKFKETTNKKVHRDKTLHLLFNL